MLIKKKELKNRQANVLILTEKGYSCSLLM